MRSVLVQLIVSFVVVIGVGVGTIAYLAQRSTSQEFQTYVQGNLQVRTSRIADGLSAYYARNGSWDGVGALLVGFSSAPGDRLVLADANGTVVADSANVWDGKPVSGLDLNAPTTITVNGSVAGSLYMDMASAGRGMGRQGGMGAGPRWMRDGQSPAEASFLDAVRRSLTLASLLAGGVALVLGLLLGCRIIRPLRLLTAGARRIAQGDLSHRVNVRPGGEIGELASAFDSMADSLDRNETARRNLLADVAHELRTPLTVIEGTADGILDGVFEPTRERVAAIRDEAALLARLIADLRDLSLAEAGRLALERKPLDMGGVAMRALDASEAAARQKGVELALDVESGLPLIEGDEARLGQVSVQSQVGQGSTFTLSLPALATRGMPIETGTATKPLNGPGTRRQMPQRNR